jgi:hypothetical protein
MKVPRRIKFIGIAFLAILFLSGLAYFLIGNSDAFMAARMWATRSQELERITGPKDAITPGFSRFNVKASGTGIQLLFGLKVNGRRDNVTVFVTMQKYDGIWKVQDAEVIRFGEIVGTRVPVD